MNLASFSAIGIDVGGTKIAAGCVTFPEATVRFRRVIPTQPERGGAAVLEDVVHLAGELIAEARSVGVQAGGIGIGLCELVGADGSVLSEATVGWMNEPVRERFAGLAPLTLEADVRAAALAEAKFGAGRGLAVFLYVTVGTGISCCLVIDGKPFVGARGATGTMASAPLGVRCEHCGTVSVRSLEETAAGPALVTRLNQRRPEPVATGQQVLAAAAAGEADALAVAREGGEALGAVLGWLINVLDPEAVVIGGGLGLSKGPFWDGVCSAVRAHVWSAVHRNIPILRAGGGPDVGLVGAAAAAWERAMEGQRSF